MIWTPEVRHVESDTVLFDGDIRYLEVTSHVIRCAIQVGQFVSPHIGRCLLVFPLTSLAYRDRYLPLQLSDIPLGVFGQAIKLFFREFSLHNFNPAVVNMPIKPMVATRLPISMDP